MGLARVALCVALVALAGCFSGAPGPAPTTAPPSSAPGDGTNSTLRLERVLDGFTQPLLLTHDERGALYVVEKGGRIHRIEGEERALWLDLSDEVSLGSEQGLLGLAFVDGRAYLDYTDRAGDSILQRVVDGRRETILTVDQPYPNHNGGHLVAGPDGFLWWGLGDGGGAGDPHNHGQDPHALLGSLLRLDVSPATGYAAPHDNPYVAGGGAQEVWAKGLRNPWRFSFDRATADLYIGDVGQNRIEEIDFVPAGTPGGLNFGWGAFEGDQRHGVLTTPFSETTPPVAQYTHDDGCSVTGGHVYRGAKWPALQGVYLFGDYCSGKVWSLRRSGAAWQMRLELDTDLTISSFGVDPAGEMYVVDLGGGTIYSIGVAR